MRKFLLSSVLICAAALAHAQDEALIVGISDYSKLPDVSGADDIGRTGNALGQVGFRLFGSGDGVTTSGALQTAGDSFASVAGDAERMVVVLAGQFVTDGVRSWLLASDSDRPAPFSIGQRALSVDTALNLLARAPGAAILVLGIQPDNGLKTGVGLRPGVGDLDIPSGVTVVRGRVDAVQTLLRDAIAVPGRDVIGAVRRDRDLTVSGFVPDRLVLVPADRSPRVVTETVVESMSNDLTRLFEGSSWDRARRENTQASYADYLDRYPDGTHATEAVSRLRDLRDPDQPLRNVEDSLNLTLEARRAIQRDLQVLGFDTRGIDGIFGPGTRNAVKSWQAQNGATQTSYLTAAQITRIDEQAARRSAEMEAQAAARRDAENRADAAYWRQTGATGTEAAMRAYLNRYPEGRFAAQARTALSDFEARNRDQAQAEDRASFDRARTADTTAGYAAYLRRPEPKAFKAQAEARLAQLRAAGSNQAANTAAAATETQLQLDPISLRLIEARLNQLGLEPGNVDGRIDGDTRAAIRRYQRDRQLKASGYLDQGTVSQMLTDAFR